MSKKDKPAGNRAHPGDHIYFHHDEAGPMSGRVVCCGAAGATVATEDGEHHKVHWHKMLGHKQRAERSARIIDEGEDGSICEDETGKRFYLHGSRPNPEEPEPAEEGDDDDGEPDNEEPEDMTKSLIIFTSAAGREALQKAIANQPGLALQRVTDKSGHQTQRWKRTAPDEHKERERGAGDDHHDQARQAVVGKVVPFSAGSFKGKGEVTAAGKDGVTVQDDSGREHQVHWHELHGGHDGDDSGSAEAAAQQDTDQQEEQGGSDGGGDEQPQFGTETSLFDESDSESLPIKAVQPVSDPDELWQKSEEALKDYDAFLTGISEGLGIEKMKISPDDADFSKPGGMLFVAPLKGQDRASEKVENKYGGDWSRLVDVVRASIAVDSYDELKSLVGKLKEGGLELAAAPEDRFHEPTPVGYSDVMLNVKLSNGTVGELQLHLKPMLEAKAEGHKPYEVIRSIAEKGPAEEWSEEDRKAHDEAVTESKRIYGEAWKKLRGETGKPGAKEDGEKPAENGEEKMTKALSSGTMILLFRSEKNG